MGILSQIKDIEKLKNLCYKFDGDDYEKNSYFIFSVSSWML